MSDMIAALNAVGARRAELTKQLETEAVAILRPLLEGFLKDHPSIESLKWRQYTPYFNDGDTCEFHVHDLEFVGTTGEEGYVTSYEPSVKRIMEETGISEADMAALSELADALSANEEVCLAAFGDHVQVIVTRDGIEVEEYSHD
jgi:hypothetical protein